MTLKDIAREAGVSVSTVSRVLNDRETKAASKAVRERIWTIIRDNDYVPNRNAQYLRREIPADVSHGPKQYYACVYARSADNKDMFFSELANAIEYEAYRHDYILKYSFYAEELDRDGFTEAVRSNEIKGIAVLGRFSEERLKAITDAQKNVVYVGLNYRNGKHDTVFCDGYQAGLMAMDTLFDYGHSQIVYFGELSRENRYESYLSALEKRESRLGHKYVVDAKQTLEGGYRAVQTLMERKIPFTAIFCANDATAMGAIKALKENHYRVPEDVSVISIDDVEMARYFTPMLTTVHIPIAELGKQTAKTLIDRIERGHTLPVKLELPVSLSKRDSCAPCRQRVQRSRPASEKGIQEKSQDAGTGQTSLAPDSGCGTGPYGDGGTGHQPAQRP